MSNVHFNASKSLLSTIHTGNFSEHIGTAISRITSFFFEPSFYQLSLMTPHTTERTSEQSTVIHITHCFMFLHHILPSPLLPVTAILAEKSKHFSLRRSQSRFLTSLSSFSESFAAQLSFLEIQEWAS